MSYAAADKLGMVEEGTTLVEVRVLGSPAVAPSPRPQPAITPASMPVNTPPTPAPSYTPEPDLGERKLYVQVGAFSEHGNAVRLAGQLKRKGVLDVFVLSDSAPTESIHRVRIGPVVEVVEYDQIVAQLETLGFTETHLVSEE